MRRRELIRLVGVAAAGVFCKPLLGGAQPQPATRLIGYLNSNSPDRYAYQLNAFREGLSEAGYVEGRNLEIAYRWAEDEDDRLPALASDLVRLRVAAIVTNAPLVTAAAKAATTTIPIVFSIGSDPVRDGFVASLNRPGGNLTGVTSLGVEVGPKVLELLHDAVPARTVGLLVNASNTNLAEPITRDVGVAARTLGLELHVVKASSEREFEAAFAALAQLDVGALVIGPDPLFGTRGAELAALALRYKMPAIYNSREFPAFGGLMSYGASLAEGWRIVGGYAGRILKGEKAAELPVQQLAKFEFVLNLKTAKALGLDVPAAMQARADEVIE
jgi:putative ABC transport system substrate-binding protein